MPTAVDRRDQQRINPNQLFVKVIPSMDRWSFFLCFIKIYYIIIIMKQNFIIKQNIPWFKTDYQEQKQWIKRKSSHYVFHYFENSLAAEEIEKIVETQEQNYRKIIKILGLENKRKIDYYLYPSEKIKESLMGDNGYGNAIWVEIEKIKVWVPKKFEVHCLYNNKIQCIGPHEDTHLLSLPYGAATFLFSEGLAEFMDEKWQGREIDIWAKEYFKKNKLYAIKFLMENKNWDKVDDMIAYPQSGSFIKYLINTYGIEKFKKMHQDLSRNKTSRENIRVVEKNCSKTIEEIEKNWKGCIGSLK